MSTTMEERASKLRERVHEDYAGAWDFKELGELVGIVESIRWAKIDDVPKVVATVKEVEGPEDARRRYAVWLSQAALFNSFRDLDIAEGELVAIRYLGQGEPARAGLSGAHRFRIEVDRPGRRFSYSGATAAPTKAYEQPTETEAGAMEHESAMERYAPPAADEDIPF